MNHNELRDEFNNKWTAAGQGIYVSSEDGDIHDADGMFEWITHKISEQESRHQEELEEIIKTFELAESMYHTNEIWLKRNDAISFKDAISIVRSFKKEKNL